MADSSPSMFYATDPAIALHRLRELEAERFRQRDQFLRIEAERLTDRLLPVFQRGITGSAETPHVEVVKEREGLAARLRELARQTSATLDIVFGADETSMDEEVIGSIIETALRNRVTSRIIFDSTVASLPLARLWSEALTTNGSQVRLIHCLPIKLSIFDESDAVIAVSEGGIDGVATGVVVTHRKTVEFLKFAFDQLWVGARQIP